MRSFLALVSLIGIMCCSVKDPGLFRETHPIVVGFPGMYVHVNRSTALGIQADEPKTTSMKVYSSGEGDRSFSINPDARDGDNFRDLHWSGWGVDVFALKFPWEKSSFFAGVDFAFREDRIAFNEHTSQFTLNRSVVNVEFKERSLNFSALIGVSKSWVSGFTVMGGFGPRLKRVSSRDVIFDGGDQVDVEKREATIASYNTAADRSGWEFLGMIGQAF